MCASVTMAPSMRVTCVSGYGLYQSQHDERPIIACSTIA